MSVRHQIPEEYYDHFRKDISDFLNNNLPSIVVSKKQKVIDLVDERVKLAMSIWHTTEYIEDKPKKIPECQHKWRDFDWYLKYSLEVKANGLRIFSYQIIEPYLCIHCKKRDNVELENGKISLTEGQDFRDIINKLIEEYPKIKNRSDVEDRINDEIRVDREYLKWADFLAGKISNPNPYDEIQLRLERDINAVEEQAGGKAPSSEGL